MPALLLHHRCSRCRHRGQRQAERAAPGAAGTAATTPAGPAAATEAFAWVNRQLSWQSHLADLEAQAGFASSAGQRTTA